MSFKSLFAKTTGVLGILLILSPSFGQTGDFAYIFPIPGSELIRQDATIIVRPKAELGSFSFVPSADVIQVTGSESGTHDFQVRVSSDQRTLNIQPLSPFSPGEQVTVDLGSFLYFSSGLNQAMSWSFEISSYQSEEAADGADGSTDRLFPELTIIESPISDELYEANIFASIRTGPENHFGLLDYEGNEISSVTENFRGADWKINRNGLPTFFDSAEDKWIMLGAEGEFFRDFEMQGFYTADSHGFQILPSGNHFIFAYDEQLVDISDEFPNIPEPQLIEGFVVQEIDYDDNLIMEWRSWDYLSILDNEQSPDGVPTPNPFHINSVEIDLDGHVVISLRHTNEIIKYNRINGDIIWRLSINQIGEFEFVNDEGFSHQHDCRATGENRYLLFDNANETTQISRAVEYQLDLQTMTATKIWEYAHPELLFGSSRGGCQRLANGNTIIHWGNVAADEYGPRTTEVNDAGDILLEFSFPIGFSGYRCPKHNWSHDMYYVGGCGDPNSPNYNPNANYWLPIFCEDDFDGDGMSYAEGDCNDNNASVYDGADEIPYDGIDQNCDGEDLTDVDGDGYTPEDGDCDDNDENAYPDAEEIPYDGIDQDCDGEDLDDVDGDGFSPNDGDCDDENEDINPDAEEIANDGIDQDCDGEDLIVGIEELEAATILYPNPTTGEFTISTVGQGNYRIMDLTGRIVQQALFSGVAKVQLDQDPGHYFVQIQTGENYFTRKITLVQTP